MRRVDESNIQLLLELSISKCGARSLHYERMGYPVKVSSDLLAITFKFRRIRY